MILVRERGLLTTFGLFVHLSAPVITMYVLAVPTIVAFLCVEAYYAENPIVPPYLWKIRNVRILLSVNVFMGMTFWSLMFYLPIYFQVRRTTN